MLIKPSELRKKARSKQGTRVLFKSAVEYYLYCPHFAYVITKQKIRPSEMTHHWPLKVSTQRAFSELMALNSLNDGLTYEEVEEIFIRHWVEATKGKNVVLHKIKEAALVVDTVNMLYNITEKLPPVGSFLTHQNYKYELLYEYPDRFGTNVRLRGTLAGSAYDPSNKGTSYTISALYPLVDLSPDLLSNYPPVCFDFIYGTKIHRRRTNRHRKIWVDLSKGTVVMLGTNVRGFQFRTELVPALVDGMRAENYRVRNVGPHCYRCPLFNDCIRHEKYAYL